MEGDETISVAGSVAGLAVTARPLRWRTTTRHRRSPCRSIHRAWRRAPGHRDSGHRGVLERQHLRPAHDGGGERRRRCGHRRRRRGLRPGRQLRGDDSGGETSADATFTLSPVDDTLVEGDETLTVSGTNADLTVSPAHIALADDDAAPAITLSMNPSNVAEGAGDTAMTVTAAFSNASTYARGTTVAVSVGDAADTAASGADYVPVAGFEMTIPAGRPARTRPSR